jgi:hypothetical protein
VSPSSGASNQNQLLRQCGGLSQQHSQFITRANNANNQQNNNSLHPGIPKVQQLDGYNLGTQNSSVTSTQGHCSVSSSMPLTTINDQHQSPGNYGKYYIEILHGVIKKSQSIFLQR